MTVAGWSAVLGGRLVAARRGTKDSTLPMVLAFLSVEPEHNATPPDTNKAPRELTDR